MTRSGEQPVELTDPTNDPAPAHDGYETATSTTSSHGEAGPDIGDRAGDASADPSADAVSSAAVRPHFPCFEGLRALAAVMVVVHHASSFAGDTRSPAAFHRVAALLDSGVIVFFVISGFLIYRPYVAAHLDHRSPMRARAFWWRRLLRLLPAYWVALSFFWAIGAFELHQDWWRYYLFLQIYDRYTATGGLVQAWSLCTEITFYLMIPVWAGLVRRLAGRGPRSPRQVAILHLAACGLLYVAAFVSRAVISSTNPLWRGISFQWLPTNIDLFALGMAVASLSAWAATDDRLRTRLDRLGRTGELWWAAAIALFAWYVVRVGPVTLAMFGDSHGAYRGWYWQRRQLVLGLASAMLLVPAVFGPSGHGLLRWLLRSRPVAWVGLVSYGLYLWHFAWMDRAVTSANFYTGVVRRGWLHTPVRDSNLFLMLAVGLGLGLLSAALSWYLVERPLERLKSLVR